MKTNKIIALVALLAMAGGTIKSNASPISNKNNVRMAKADDASDEIKRRCKAAVDAVELNVDLDNVVADIILPAFGLYSSKLTWTSSNEAVIKIEEITNDNGKVLRSRARVIRPSEDTSVKLTVTATIANHEADFQAKAFNLKVLKAMDVVEEEIPAEFEEDFSSYDTGLDLGDYYSYSQSGSEAFLAAIVDDTDSNLSNVNNMVSSKALRLTSSKQSSDTRYLRKANVNSVNAPKGGYVEGNFLYTGNTNGVSIELLNGNNAISSIKFASSGISQLVSKNTISLNTPITEGVWIKFCITFTLTGYSYLSIYDYATESYQIIGDDTENGTVPSLTGFVHMGTVLRGFSSGNKGNVTGFRIVNHKGKNNGFSYLSDLRLGLTPSETVTNPNRTNGIGIIDNFQSSVFAKEEELATLDAVNPATFVLHNRFNTSATYTNGTDYSIESKKIVISDSEIKNVFTFTLTSTGEKKTLTQLVYLFNETTAPSILSFKAKALEADKEDKTKATITLTGIVNRNDANLHYMILSKGSVAPSVAQLLSDAEVTGKVDGGTRAITTREFAFASNKISLNGQYDVYAMIENSVGQSTVSSSLEISTVINITSCQDFYDMATNVDTMSSIFRLMQDLDFSEFYWDFVSSEFEFHGSLDGEGHTISNLLISTTDKCAAIFNKCYGIVKNITFKNAKVFGSDNVGIIGGHIYGGTYENINFIDCETSVEPNLTEAGEGYFGALGGRCRGEKHVIIKNVNIVNIKIECPKYCGLLTGGIEKEGSCEMENVYASGSVDTDGAAIGLIGRNRGATTIKNLVVDLNIINAKKEVGAVAGHNKEGGSLTVTNAILDVKIYQITQPGYFASFIGSYDAASSKYSVTNVSYIDEDYSDLGDYTTDVKSINAGTRIHAPESAKEWEENTFIRDFDTNLSFSYDETDNRPVLNVRSASEIVVTAKMFEEYVNELDESNPTKNHYYLVKASEVLNYLSSAEKAKISSSSMSKYESCLKTYNDLVDDLQGVLDGIKIGA